MYAGFPLVSPLPGASEQRSIRRLERTAADTVSARPAARNAMQLPAGAHHEPASMRLRGRGPLPACVERGRAASPAWKRGMQVDKERPLGEPCPARANAVPCVLQAGARAHCRRSMQVRSSCELSRSRHELSKKSKHAMSIQSRFIVSFILCQSPKALNVNVVEDIVLCWPRSHSFGGISRLRSCALGVEACVVRKPLFQGHPPAPEACNRPPMNDPSMQRLYGPLFCYVSVLSSSLILITF